MNYIIITVIKIEKEDCVYNISNIHYMSKPNIYYIK